MAYAHALSDLGFEMTALRCTMTSQVVFFLRRISYIKAQAFAPLSRGGKKVVPTRNSYYLHRNVDDNLK
jgi:hypothetical protein